VRADAPCHTHPVKPERALAVPSALATVRPRVDDVLVSFLEERRAKMAAIAPAAAEVVDEIHRLVSAGGKRIRPAFCYWGYRAAGGEDGEAIFRAAAGLELFHTFALVHDDVMDESTTRRGVPTTHARFAQERWGTPGAAQVGRSVAVLAGDLAAVLADEALLGSGFPPNRLLPALRRYARMREEVAAGQFLDLTGTDDADEASAGMVASLKTGSYTVEGPLHIGALLAGGSPELLAALTRYAAPLGRAFQMRDDVLDRGNGVVAGATVEAVNRLVADAGEAARDPAIGPEASTALRSLAEVVALPAS
jgi:geranylgeranyl diphosphate synthase, type I